jgi:hypothetical protein
MADAEPRTASTLTEMMRRRAALTPDRQYFYLYGETVTYGRLWEQSGRFAAALAGAGVRGRQGLSDLSDVRRVLFHVRRRAPDRRRPGPHLPDPRRRGHGADLPRLGGGGSDDHRLVPAGRRRQRGPGPGRADRPGPPDLDLPPRRLPTTPPRIWLLQYTSGARTTLAGDAHPPERQSTVRSWPRPPG